MRWHDLRHTYATVLKENDISLKAISVCMGHNGTGVTKDVYINLPEEIYDCEKVIGNFIIDILPQTDFVFDIQISEKDLLELLPQKYIIRWVNMLFQNVFCCFISNNIIFSYRVLNDRKSRTKIFKNLIIK